MRILAWNPGWNVSERALRLQTAAVAALGADVTFFSEWSPLQDRLTSAGTVRSSNGHLRGPELAGIGLTHQCHEHVADRAGDGLGWSGAYWGVLAAARLPITKIPLMPPLHAPGSWLEITHQESGLTLVGVRVPAWEGREIHRRRELWEWMIEQFDRLSSTPAVVIGDFNTETDYSSPANERKYGGDLLRRIITELGWADPYEATRTPEQPTYWHRSASRRIDHALVSPAFTGTIDGIDATCEVGRLVLSGPSRADDGSRRARLADHAPLVIDLSTAEADRTPASDAAGTAVREVLT